MRGILLQGSLDDGLYRFSIIIFKNQPKLSPVPVSESIKDQALSCSIESRSQALSKAIVNESCYLNSKKSVNLATSGFALNLWHQKLGQPALDIVIKVLVSCN